MDIYVIGVSEPVDLACWRHYRSQAPGIVEAVLEANKGVEAYGPFPPPGTKLVMPPKPATKRQTLKLWS